MTDGAPAGGVPQKQLSVLAALDGKPPTAVGRGSRGAWPWVLGLGGLVVAAVAVMVATRGPAGEAPRPAPVERAAAPAVAPVVSAAVAPTPPSAAAMPAPPAASAAAVAAVEDLPAVAAVGAAAAATAAVASAEPAARPAQEKRSKPKPAPEKRTQVAQAKPKPKPAAKPGTPPATTTTTTATTAARAAKGATVAAAGTAAAATASTGDADVDLIAALVQHMNRQEAQGAAGGVVTIAELVGRCKSLAGDDALRCQRRICENYWGRAEACPRSLAPRDVAARP